MEDNLMHAEDDEVISFTNKLILNVLGHSRI